jgi:hypothetical protein
VPEHLAAERGAHAVADNPALRFFYKIHASTPAFLPPTAQL